MRLNNPARPRELGRLPEARQALEEALSLYREQENATGEGMVLCSLADLHRDGGALDTALGLAQRALDLPELAGNDEHAAHALLSLGSVQSRLSHLDLAAQNLLGARMLACDIGDRELEAEALIALAEALTRAGRHHEATTHARQALAVSRQTEHGLLEGLALTALAQDRACAGDGAGAAELARQAHSVLEPTGHHLGLAAAARLVADCLARVELL